MISSPLYQEETPIEEYFVKGVRVFVKRDDLYGRSPAPPLGKLRGLRVLLRDLFNRNVLLVGCWDTRVSRLGHGLAAACQEFGGMHAVVSYPTKKGMILPEPIAAAERLGAMVLPLRGNHVSICYAQARTRVQALGGQMLPFGLECREAVVGVAHAAAQIPAELSCGTVVLCCGSGVTLAGLLSGFAVTPTKIIGISSGRSLAKIGGCVQRFVGNLPSCVELVPAKMPYEATPAIRCPFPTHPNYDLKAWQFLCEHINRIAKPILFWNIGA